LYYIYYWEGDKNHYIDNCHGMKHDQSIKGLEAIMKS